MLSFNVFAGPVVHVEIGEANTIQVCWYTYLACHYLFKSLDIFFQNMESYLLCAATEHHVLEF